MPSEYITTPDTILSCLFIHITLFVSVSHEYHPCHICTVWVLVEMCPSAIYWPGFRIADLLH